MMRIFITIILFFFVGKLTAQHSLRIIPLDKDTAFLKKIFPLEIKFGNDFDRYKQLQDNLFKLYANGFLAASFDSVVLDTILNPKGFKNLSGFAFLKIGSQYKWLHLSNGNIDEGALSSAGFREKLYSNKIFSYKNLIKLQERILTYEENNGFPFAVVKLDSIRIDGENLPAGQEGISAKISLNKNQQIIIDSVNIEGNAKITRRYLQNYIGVKPKDFYNEAVIKKISTRIKELPFLQEEKPVNIAFTEEKTQINLFLKNKKASRFNFLIGFLPNNQQTGKLLVTGDAMLNLQNTLGAGEIIDLNWKKYQALSQNLKLKFLYPYLPLLPFGIDFNFELYKKDTTYLDLVRNIGLQYSFTGGNYLKAFYHNKTSTILTVDTIRIRQYKTLPDNLDISFNMYGLEYKLEKLDYRINPRKGFDFKISGGAGVKKIKRNSTIEKLQDTDFNYSSLYDSIKLTSVQYQGIYFFNYYFPLAARTVVKAGTIGGIIFSENIFNNELYRIGGNQLLRGFDEESILASLYNVVTLEYRYLIEQNSYLYLFGDGAYLENLTAGKENIYSAHPIAEGFGAGITFETKLGIFALSYALGSQFGQPIQLKTAKIHFGYVNYF